MENVKLIRQLELIKKQIEVMPNQQTKLLKLVNECIEIYKVQEIPSEKQNLYDFLNKKSAEVIASFKHLNDKRKAQEILKYLRFARAAKYDFNEKTHTLANIGRYFVLMCVLFFALSPQFFGFIFPLIMVLPIFMGLKGLKNRTRVGFYLALSVVPMALLVSTNWVKYFIYSIQDLDTSVQAIMASAEVSDTVAKVLVFLPSIGGIALLVFTCMLGYLSIKHHKLFI